VEASNQKKRLPAPFAPLVGPATATRAPFSRLLLPDEPGEGTVAGAALSRAPGLAVHPELPAICRDAVAVVRGVVGGVHCRVCLVSLCIG